ncbi:hypothetical protein JCM21900_002905 [Sporobolomyces salmonicolor]
MASSRLKRKIEVADEGQYGNLTESFVSVGTPLPALTENKKDKNEFKPVWQQEVYDEQGRRRLHGAFTGGFSAGYFNTVGSKEGWTPSTFKSSRTNRANQNNRSVVDAAKEFMDEEDLAELASSRTLETSSAYASQQRPSAPKPAEYDPLLGDFGALGTSAPAALAFDDPLAALIQPSSSRVGLKLMRKMGWRDGQGVGPRVTLRQRKQQASELGLRLDEEDQEGSEAERHYYAPLDRPLTLVKGASASMDKGWGLGYQPGLTLEAQLSKEGIAGGGRGVSSYEMDDYDVYGGAGVTVDTLGDREKRAWAAFEGEEEEGYGLMRGSRDLRSAKPAAKHAAQLQDFHDGTRLLPGFVLYSEPFAGPSTSSLPPPPPPGWRPDPTRLWKENTPPAAGTDGKGKGKQLDAEERGFLLGEKAPPPVPKSVFDYLSSKSRERLASLTGSAGAPSSAAAPDAAQPTPPEPDAQLFVPPLDRPTALAALKGFQPYSAASTSPDPVKQARYTLYLQYQASTQASTTSSPFGPRKLPNGKMQTVDELNRELSEYAQSAKVFKPVSGMLGNRFQSSTSGSLDTPKIEPGLYQPPPKAAAADPSSSNYLAATYGDAASAAAAPPEPKLTPAQAAARAGNFGPLTRTVTQFRPARLLCKRFGVRDPHEDAGGAEEGGVGGAWGEASRAGWGTGNAPTSQPIGKSALDAMMQSAGFKRFQEASKEVGEDEPEVAKGVFETPSTGESTLKRSKSKAKPTIETVGLGDDESQGQEIVEEKKAPADIFAAIFADSDDEEDEEEDELPAASLNLAPAVPPSATVLSTDAVTSAPPPPAPEAPAEPLSLETISSYRPSFVPTSSRTTASADADTAASSKPKKKKPKRKAGTLSFDVDDGEENGEDLERPRKKKDKKEREREREKERGLHGSRGKTQRQEEEDEWEEAAPQVHPSILAGLQKPLPSMPPAPDPEQSKAPKGRMKAADLY